MREKSLEEDADSIINLAPERMREMLESVYFYNRGINDNLLARILEAMSIIDRKFFVAQKEEAYYDNAMSIGKGQTISQPSTVARMLLLANLEQGDDVLEIGTGSGWNACLIAFLVYPGSVTSIDRISSLIEKAQENISFLRSYLKQKNPQDVSKIEKISFLAEDIFSKGRAWEKKYDKIIITAGIADEETENKIEEMAQSLLNQNGILICPYVSGPLAIYRKKGRILREYTKEHYVFVPLLEGTEK